MRQDADGSLASSPAIIVPVSLPADARVHAFCPGREDHIASGLVDCDIANGLKSNPALHGFNSAGDRTSAYVAGRVGTEAVL